MIERRDRWEARYQDRDRLWSPNPNPVLTRVAQSLACGTALDIACGEGADAIWLAEQGWQVTGVDFASTAIARSREHAAERGVADATEFIVADLKRWRPTRIYDLAAVHYFHATEHFGTQEILRELMPAAVAPRGSLLIVGHSAFPSWSEPARRGVTLPTPEETLANLHLESQGWDVVECGFAPHTATSPDGEVEDLPDVVVWAKRRR